MDGVEEAGYLGDLEAWWVTAVDGGHRGNVERTISLTIFMTHIHSPLLATCDMMMLYVY